MEPALAIAGSTEASKHLVGELGAGVGARLTLLYVADENGDDERRERLRGFTSGDSAYSVVAE